MYQITQINYSQQLPNQDTSVSVRRSKIEIVEGQEIQSEHHRLSFDCLTFANNLNYLHEQLIKLPGGYSIKLDEETNLEEDLNALWSELILKGWMKDSQLVLDYQDWVNSLEKF